MEQVFKDVLDDFAIPEESDDDWEALYLALTALHRLTSNDATEMNALFAADANLWPKIVELLLYSHAWVRLAAAQLVGVCLSCCSLGESLSLEFVSENQQKFFRRIGDPNAENRH